MLWHIYSIPEQQYRIMELSTLEKTFKNIRMLADYHEKFGCGL